MRILTWNVNSIRSCFEKDGAYRLADLKCDVLCFQETKCHEDQFSSALLSEYKGFWSNGRRKGYSGVATFSKVPTKLSSTGIGIRRYDHEGRVVVCDLKDFLLYNIYFPNGAGSEERHHFKQEFLADLNNHLKDVLNSGREIVLVGDYNVAPAAVDVFDPEALKSESGFLPEERDWFKSLLSLGFVDTFRKVNPEVKDKYTWWSYKDNARVKNRGWRIDHICVSTGLTNRVVAAEVRDDLHGSDHCPVILELN